MKKFLRILLAILIIFAPLSTVFISIDLSPITVPASDAVRQFAYNLDNACNQLAFDLQAARYGDKIADYITSIKIGSQLVQGDAVDLYWVGGAAAWDGTAGTKWATVSGGAGGHAVPTSTNKVIFDGGSGAAVVTVSSTAPTCADLVFTGTGDFAGTFGVGVGTVNVYGSLTMVAGMTLSGSVTYDFKDTAGAKTITTATKTPYSFVFSGTTGGWTLQDAVVFASGASLTQTGGTLDTNGQDITITSGSFVSSGATARTLTLGATDIIVTTGSFTLSGSGLTFNCNTSTITVHSDVSTNTFDGLSKTFNVVSLTADSSTILITGANTYGTLSVINTVNKGSVTFDSTQTISGVLTLTGFNTGTARLSVYSSAHTTQRTLNSASNTITNTIFEDIIGAGAGSWDISAGNNLDGGNNTGITFTSSSTNKLYWVGGTASWDFVAGTKWSLVSGGAGGHAYPTTSDNVYIDANSGVVTITQGQNINVADLIFTGFSGAFPGGGAHIVHISGSLTLSPTMTLGGVVHDWHFAGGTGTITTNGINIGGAGDVNIESGTYTLADNMNAAVDNFTASGGTLNTNGFSVTCSQFFASGSTLNFGASSIIVDHWSCTGGTINPGTSTIYAYEPGGGWNFIGGGKTYYSVVIYPQGAGNGITGANTFTNLSIIGVNVANNSLNFQADQTIGTFVATGYNATTRRLLLYSNAVGTPRQLTLTNNAVITYVDFRDIAGNPSSKWDLSLMNAGNKGGNYGITFTTPRNIYWVMNSGNWSDTNRWSFTSGGAGGTGRVPIPGIDTAIFDANSTTMPTRTITIDMDVCSIDATAAANTPTFASGSTVGLYGSLSLGAVTWNPAITNYHRASVSTISSNSTLNGAVAIDVLGQTCRFMNNAVLASSLTLTSGILDLNGYSVTAASFDSSTTTYERYLYMGEGTFTLTSTGVITKWNVVATNYVQFCETSTILLTNSGVSAQSFTPGASQTFRNVTIAGAGNYALSITAAATFYDLTIDRSLAAKTVKFPTSATTTITGGFSIPISGTTVVTLVGTTAPPTANVWTISKASGFVASDYLSIEDSTASGGATFYAGDAAHSTFVSHVTGWILTLPPNPILHTDVETNVTATTVQLNGEITNLGGFSPVYVFFQYGYTTAYGYSTAEQTKTATGTFLDTISVTAGTYHYRAAVRYVSGTNLYQYGLDEEIVIAGTVGGVFTPVPIVPDKPRGAPLPVGGTGGDLLPSDASMSGTGVPGYILVHLLATYAFNGGTPNDAMAWAVFVLMLYSAIGALVGIYLRRGIIIAICCAAIITLFVVARVIPLGWAIAAWIITLELGVAEARSG